MSALAVHPRFQIQIDHFTAQPGHAVLLTGSSGLGKIAIAKLIAVGLLRTDTERLEKHPYFKIISPDKPESMSIEQVRELQHYLTLKVPGGHDHHTSRVVILENAHLLTLDAQNALLKTLEEPPEKTVLILTASVEQALLPTVRSRLQTLQVLPPTREQIESHFINNGYSSEVIAKALRIGGRLPGLIEALLINDTEHPLLVATDTARKLLQATRFERLAQVDELAKNKINTLNTLSILQHMAEITLKQQPSLAAQEKWAGILRSSHLTQAALLKNAQPKLALTNLMFSL
jgi:DNA polymerase III delta prime subunit